MSTAEQYQKLESESSQGEIPSDAIPKDGSVLTDSQKASLEGQEIIMGQVVSMPTTMVSGSPEAMTRHTSTASHQHPINPGAPRRPPNGGYYEMAHYQTVNQGQPPAFSVNSYDPEIGLPNSDSSQLLEYHELYRAGRPGCWRPFVGLLGLGCGVSFLCALILLYLFIIIYNIVGSTFDPQLEEGMELTPDILAYANLVLASAIPVAGYLTQELHGVHYGWLSSVVRKIRWSWLRTCLVLSAIVLFVTMLVSAALSAMTSTSVEATGNDEFKVNEWTDQTTSFLFVVLLLTPLQAAGEEYAFRGYLTQAFGGLCSKWIAIFVPSFLFALAHGSQTGPVFFDRFAFGFVSGLLVVETGGLEAGIAMHILNNFAAFGWAILFGDITSAMEPSSENWWGIIVTLTQSVGYFVLARKMARKKNIQTSVRKVTVQQPISQVVGFYPVPMAAP